MPDGAGSVIDERYALEHELGRGGMATVWRARDLRHERPVAIKIIHPELAGAIGVERFVREVRLTARLQHPNIVPVLDSGILPATGGTGLPWFAMMYLEGESLRDRLSREGQLPIEDALRITEAVADALQAAHRQGIFHRDIKPENVVLAGGRTYVVDFGIAKAILDTGSERLTSTGFSIGTPAYMSPEQTSAEAIDARSDQYSLAAMLYELLTGEPPFTGNTQAIVARRFTEPARPLRTVRSTIPEPVERAVLRALERVPADRFPDVAAFAAALRAPVAPGIVTTSGPTPGRRWLAAGGGLVVVAALGAWLLAGSAGKARKHSADPVVVALQQRGVRGYDRRSAAGITDAIAAFSAAIKRDSAYGPAWNGLAKSYVRAFERHFTVPGTPRDSMLALAIAAVENALASDSGSADTWLTQALLSRTIGPTDNGPVLRSLRRSLALDSTVARAWHYFAVVQAENGDLAGAVASWRRSARLDPAYTEGLTFLALGHYWRRQYDSAGVWADSAVALDPNYLLARNTVAYVAVERGDYTGATAAFEAARRLSNDVESLSSLAGVALAEARAGQRAEAGATMRTVESQAKAYTPAPLHLAVFMAQAYAALGDAGRATAWLSRYEPRRSLHFQLHLRCDPPFDPIRSDPRFRALLTAPAPPPGQAC